MKVTVKISTGIKTQLADFSRQAAKHYNPCTMYLTFTINKEKASQQREQPNIRITNWRHQIQPSTKKLDIREAF